VEIVDSRLTVRSEWRPDPELSPEERERKIAEALDESNRANIYRVPGGFQNIMDFRRISARLNEVVLADPDEDRTVLDVAALRAIAQPYRPPVADVRGLEGRFYISADSVWFEDVRARLPGSRLTATGAYHLESADLLLRMEGEPASFPDLRWLYPSLPEEGGGQLSLRVQRRQAGTRLYVEDMDVRLDGGKLTGDLRLVVGDTFRILPTDLAFSNLDIRPVERMIPGFESPAQGRLDGRLALRGDGSRMQVDGDIAIDHAPTGRSRVIAEGGLGMTGQTRFQDLRITFSPLRTDLVRGDVPRLPASATITGQAVVDGVLDGPLRLNADLALEDPITGRSRVLAEGGIDPRGPGMGFSGLALRFQPLRSDLLRPELPQLPPGSTITGPLRLDGRTSSILTLDGDLAIADPATGDSRVALVGGLDLRDGLRFRQLALRFDPLRGALLRDQLPDLPPDATLLGRLLLDGDATGLLRLDGDLTLQDPQTGESRIAGVGGLDLTGPLAFRDLDVRLDPLQASLLRRFEPDLPLGGTITGTASLDGRPGSRLAVRGDLVHREADELSRVVGRVEVVPRGWAAVDVRLQPLSLVVAGRFVPEAGLTGEVAGHLQATGDLGDLALRTDLAVPDGGQIVAEGRLDLESNQPAYDLTTRLRDFDLSAVTVRAPAATDLTGAINATGRGLEPATMRAEIQADLVGSSVDGVAADEVRLRLGIADGLARVDSSTVRIGETVAWADGEFGLVEWRDGELRYQVGLADVDVVAPLGPTVDTAVVRPRPAAREAALAEARAAAERAERRRLVELIATGQAPPAQELEFDTVALAGIRRDTVAGRLEAEGVARGNVQVFDLLGTAKVENLYVRGNFIGAGEAEYSWVRRGVPAPVIEVDATAARLVVEGFALDSALARVRHEGGGEGPGRAVVTAWQDDDTDYHADVEFTLALDRQELLIHDLAMRFDTLSWQSARPGRVVWDAAAVVVEDVELVSDRGGLIALDGRLPVEGAVDLDLVLREVELAHLGLLLQDEEDIHGRISLEARVQGTRADLELEAVGIVADAARNGQELPDARLDVSYRGRELTVMAELFEEVGRTFAIVEARLPIDLALDERRPVLTGGELSVDVRADSLPIDGVAALTDAISNVEGVAAGEFTVRGTWDSPRVEGEVTVVDGAFRVEPTGVRYRDAAGTFRLSGSELVVDSLVADGGGPVRVTGVVDLSTLTEPGFDLEVTARNAWAMRTDDLQLRIDADLEISGPFDRVVVTGEARTRRGVIYIPETRDKAVVSLDEPTFLEELEGRLLAAAEEYIERPSPLLANLEVDVALHIEPDTWIRSTDYNIEVYTPPDLGPLRVALDQRAGRLTLEGTVNSDRGDYSFMGRRFRVARGAATFIGAAEPDPLLQVTAEHEVQMAGREDFSIRVVIGGTALRPTLTVENDARPPIPDTEIFAYIGLGRSAGAVLQQQRTTLSGQGAPTGDLVGNVAGLATMQMAALAANTMLDELESEMARQLGLDVLHISPADLPAELFTGQFEDLIRGTEVEAGLYIGPRLFAAIRARPTTESRPGATLEYSTPAGYRWTTTLDPRFLPGPPTLREVEPQRASVFGAFVWREWRF
jgi:translocation and assembly module TamB